MNKNIDETALEAKCSLSYNILEINNLFMS